MKYKCCGLDDSNFFAAKARRIIHRTGAVTACLSYANLNACLDSFRPFNSGVSWLLFLSDDFQIQQMRRLFDRLIEREKFLLAVTFVLIVTLVLQVRFCGGDVGSDVTVSRNQTEAHSRASASGSPGSLTGIWEMSVQKKNGGVQNWTLTLTQNGDALSGVIRSEGGDLPVSGTIKGDEISLSAKRFGTTVEFPARFDGEAMTGTMKALMVRRQWTAKRR